MPTPTMITCPRRGRTRAASGAMAAFAFLLLLTLALRAPADAPPAVYPDNSRLRPILESAHTRRVALVGIGDSNQLFNAHGWDSGLFNALSRRYVIWGTPLLAAGEDYGYGAAIGTGSATQPASYTNDGSFFFGVLPMPYETLMSLLNQVPPFNALHVPPEADSPFAAPPHGMLLTASSALDLTAPLRFTFTHALFPEGRDLFAYVSEGTWGGPLVAQQPFSTLAPARAPVPARPSDPERPEHQSDHDRAFEPAPTRTEVLDLPAAFRPPWLRLWFGDDRQRARGPLLLTYLQAENPGRTTGFAVHTLYALGGASARDMAGTLLSTSDAQLGLFFERVRAPLGPSPRVVVRINAGLNDRSEWVPSAASGILPGSSPLAFTDNIDAIIRRVTETWERQNWDWASELHFLITVSHPIASADDPWLFSYRFAVRSLADRLPNVTVVDLSNLVNADEMAARGWYNTAEDRFHLQPEGYAELARRELVALIKRPCFEPADIDHSGNVNTRDLIAVLQDFGQPYLTAGQGGDLDADGDCDTFDLVRFLSRFGESTCNATP